MQLVIDIPNESVERFREVFGPDLDQAAKEALLITGYRSGRVSLGFVAEMLGLATRLEAQAWLAARDVPLNYDFAEYEADLQTLREFSSLKPS